ncbi:MAG: HAD family hydrolase [Bacillaceae bacterium]|nr:HAD family hydrolase [Bacillaceae bacterium]
MFRMILFDVDGVILSEERYFDASALTVWEMLYSPKYLGLSGDEFTPAPEENVIRRVRKDVFADDRVLNFVKGRGINANWDMVYLTFGYQLVRLLAELYKENPEAVKPILKNQIGFTELETINRLAQHSSFTPDYGAFVDDFSRTDVEKQALLKELNGLIKAWTGIDTDIFSRNSTLWDVCQETFQEWYLGDDKVEESIGRPARQSGKKGFLHDEIPIVEVDRMRDLFMSLKNKGITIGIGTGRPQIETIEPLRAMGLLECFDTDRIVSASYVLEAEREYPERAPLAKPQPFCYVAGMLGLEHSVEEALNHPLPVENGDEILIVGDSVADLMAARSMGVKFAATLTGLSGQEARGKFEDLKADYILDDVLGVKEIV